MRVLDRDPVARPLDELDVVLAVAEGDRPLAREAVPLREELEPGALGDAERRELEELRQRLRHPEAVGEARAHPLAEAVERVGVADADDLRRRLRQPRLDVADGVDRDLLEAGVRLRACGHARDVELVADVDVRVVALGLDGGDRLARELEVDRDVQEPLPVGADDDGALVADDRVVQTGGIEHAPQGLHHPAGDDDHGHRSIPRAGERRERPRLQHPGGPGERVVEVGRDHVDLAREVRWEGQPCRDALTT